MDSIAQGNLVCMQPPPSLVYKNGGNSSGSSARLQADCADDGADTCHQLAGHGYDGNGNMPRVLFTSTPYEKRREKIDALHIPLLPWIQF